VLAIRAIFRNQALYLREWIEFPRIAKFGGSFKRKQARQKFLQNYAVYGASRLCDHECPTLGSAPFLE